MAAVLYPLPDGVTAKIQQAAELAHPIYVAHGWKWGVNWRPLKEGEKYEVPTVAEIATTIERLYRVAWEESGSCSSGRLSVDIDPADGEVNVSVQLAEWTRDGC